VTKTNFELLQFVVVVEQLQLHLNSWQDSSWSDMSALSGETTTTNGFDGRLFSFFVHATIAIWSDNKDKRFPMPVRQAGKRVSPV